MAERRVTSGKERQKEPAATTMKSDSNMPDFCTCLSWVLLDLHGDGCGQHYLNIRVRTGDIRLGTVEDRSSPLGKDRKFV